MAGGRGVRVRLEIDVVDSEDFATGVLLSFPFLLALFDLFPTVAILLFLFLEFSDQFVIGFHLRGSLNWVGVPRRASSVWNCACADGRRGLWFRSNGLRRCCANPRGRG